MDQKKIMEIWIISEDEERKIMAILFDLSWGVSAHSGIKPYLPTTLKEFYLKSMKSFINGLLNQVAKKVDKEAKERYYKNMFSKSLIGCSATFNHETGKSMGCLARELCDNCLSPPDHLVRKAQSEFHKTITGRTVFHKSNMEEIPKKNRLKKIRNEIRKNRAKIRRMRFTAIWRGDNMGFDYTKSPRKEDEWKRQETVS